MKKNKYILAGVDYSASSENAVKYAAALAKNRKLGLLLFHVYDVPVLHANSGLYFISFSSLQNSNKQRLEKYAQSLRGTYPDLSIDCVASPELFKEELERIIRNREIRYVVMGMSVKDKISKFIYGSHGTSIAGRINAPVIIVPENYKKHKLHQAVIAVDNQKPLKKTVSKNIVQFSKDFGIKYNYLHVKTEDEFQFQNGDAAPADLPVEVIKAKEFTDGACKYARRSKSDMIVIVSRAHSALYNFFNESNTKKIAFQSRIPVMAFHE